VVVVEMFFVLVVVVALVIVVILGLVLVVVLVFYVGVGVGAGGNGVLNVGVDGDCVDVGGCNFCFKGGGGFGGVGGFNDGCCEV